MTEVDAFKLFSLPFDFHIWLDDDRINSLVNEIAEPIIANRDGNKIRDDYKEKLLLSYKIILLNLLCVHKHKASECLAIPLNNTQIQPHKRYGLRGLISVDSFREAYDSLCQDYIVLLKKGQEGLGGKKGFLTRIKTTPKLERLFDQYFPETLIFFERHPKEEVVILKSNKYDQDDKFKDYKETEETQRQRCNLKEINRVLQSNWYDLELSDKQFEVLRLAMKRRHIEDSKKHFYINFANRRLRRIYNNGIFQKGGRFYGGWWQSIPKEYRKHIRINGTLTVEIDFSNMHPFLLYAKEGIEFDGDAYEIDGLTRKKAKLAFNLLLNKDSFRKPRDYNPDSWDGHEWKKLKKIILDRHEKIAHYFGKGVGLDLQYLDSQIAEIVMLYFTRINAPCLPLHDSFIVHHALKDELLNEMKKAYTDVMGEWDIGTDCQDYFQQYSDAYAQMLYREDKGIEISEDIDNLLIAPNEYNNRLQLWYQSRDT